MMGGNKLVSFSSYIPRVMTKYPFAYGLEWHGNNISSLKCAMHADLVCGLIQGIHTGMSRFRSSGLHHASIPVDCPSRATKDL